MNPKILVAVLVGVGLLFFCGVGLGFRPGNNGQGTTGLPGQDVFLSLVQKPVQADDISAGCWNGTQFTLAANTVCSGTIRRSDETVRSLWLQLTSAPPAKANMELAQPNSVTAKPTVTSAHRDAKLDVFKDQADSNLNITCLGGPCVLKMVTPTPRP
jgi:hypothetical protein